MTTSNIDTAKSWYRGLRDGGWHDLVDNIFHADLVYLNFAKTADSPETHAAIPWSGEWSGAAGLAEFQKLIDANFVIDGFDDHTYLEVGDQVAIFSRLNYTARSTGRSVASDTATLMHFRDGRIGRYQFYENTFAIANAFRVRGSWAIRNSMGERSVPAETTQGEQR